MDDLVTSRTGIQYSLKQALMRNPVTIKAGDDISAVALARIEALEAQLFQVSAALNAASDLAALVEELIEPEVDFQVDWDVTATRALTAYRKVEGVCYE